MARLSIGDKAHRVLQFMMGVRNRRVSRALAKYGFNESELTHGWELLQRLTAGRLDVTTKVVDPRLIGELDEWENRWFPIVEVVLRTRFPDAHAIVFRNLAQTDGAEVVVSVTTLLDRVEKLALPTGDGGLGDPGRAAREMLTTRGFDDDAIGEARRLLTRIGSIEAAAEPPEPVVDEAASEAAQQDLWNWYLEWSAIARVAIRDRRLLRALGFLRTVRKGDVEVDVEVPDEPTVDTPDVPTEPEAPRPTA